MKHTRLLILASLLFFLVVCRSAMAAGKFEGDVEMTMTHAGQTSTMIYSMKGDKARMVITSAKMPTTVLLDPSQQKMYIVFDQMKMYMEHDMSKSVAQSKLHAQMGEFANTGKTETILGRTCEMWSGTDSTGVTHDAWVTAGIGSLYLLGGGPMQGTDEPPAIRAMRDKGFFPMRVVTHKGSDELSRMEVTKIEEKSLDAALFELPAGYQKMDMHHGMGK